jgi:phosphatidylserine synthase
MNRQQLFYGLLTVTTLLVLSLSPLESHSYKLAEIALYLAIAALIGITVTSTIALWNFRHQSNEINRGNLLLFGGLPVGIGLLLTLFHPNVHGISLPAFFFYALISELSALTLLVCLAFRVGKITKFK